MVRLPTGAARSNPETGYTYSLDAILLGQVMYFADNQFRSCLHSDKAKRMSILLTHFWGSRCRKSGIVDDRGGIADESDD